MADSSDERPQSDTSRSDSELPTSTRPLPSEGLLAPGVILGERYQVRSLIGRGGMGEVWLAFDLRLRIDVALKSLFRDEHSRERLRSEVLSARDVISPHVCRVFDLVTVDDHELLSMEYIDGATLLEFLKERGPLVP